MTTTEASPDAVLLGVGGDGAVLADASIPFGLKQSKLNDLWKSARTKNKAYETRTFYGLGKAQEVVGLINLGKGDNLKSEIKKAEFTRKACATGAQALRNAGASHIVLDEMYSAHAAAEGALLGLYKFDRLKTSEEADKSKIAISPITASTQQSTAASTPIKGQLMPLTWQTGLIYATAQNLSRTLGELPANIMTPTTFCKTVSDEFEKLPSSVREKVQIEIHDAAWAEEQNMRTFLSVAKGSDEPCKFLEIKYNGGEEGERPLVFVGKGITFDSGGISIKPAAGMKLMRGDMCGGAAVASSTWAVAALGLPVNLVTCVPLCENLPSGRANKPGDIIVSRKGTKTIEIDNTDAEGRLILADALDYASKVYKPHTIIDVATLTGAMVIALGEVYTGVYSSTDQLWQDLEKAGTLTNDLFWRMPFHETYMNQINKSNADLCNTGGRLAGCCTAAIFLREFVDGLPAISEDDTTADIQYAHLDMAGSMEAVHDTSGYNVKGLTGRPVRGLIEYVRQLASRSA